MNYIKWYIGDYMKKTGTLSIAEHGAYTLMLQHYYATEEPLPTGRDLYHLLRALTKQERDAVEVVTSRYWQSTPAGLVHERADEEIRKAAIARDKHAECGKKGGRPRNQTETNLVSETKPNEKPTNTNTITPSLRSGGARASRLPDDWLPDDEGWRMAVEALTLAAARNELAKFRDYWKARPGKDGTKLDWNATWRNWVRKAGEYAQGRGNSTAGRESAVDRVRRLNAAALEDGGEVLAPHDGNLRPQVDVDQRNADRAVVDGAFRVVG